MPYNYVLDAIAELYRIERHECFNHEKPIALNSSILANANRDPKKNKKGFSYTDFSFFVTKSDLRMPDGHYGACALQLREMGKYPSWALFCFKELHENASKTYKSSNCALIAEDAIILSPQIKENSVTGLLIARETVSDTRLTFEDMLGNFYVLAMPEISTKVIAQESIELARFD